MPNKRAKGLVCIKHFVGYILCTKRIREAFFGFWLATWLTLYLFQWEFGNLIQILYSTEVYHIPSMDILESRPHSKSFFEFAFFPETIEDEHSVSLQLPL